MRIKGVRNHASQCPAKRRELPEKTTEEVMIAANRSITTCWIKCITSSFTAFFLSSEIRRSLDRHCHTMVLVAILSRFNPGRFLFLPGSCLQKFMIAQISPGEPLRKHLDLPKDWHCPAFWKIPGILQGKDEFRPFASSLPLMRFSRKKSSCSCWSRACWI